MAGSSPRGLVGRLALLALALTVAGSLAADPASASPSEEREMRGYINHARAGRQRATLRARPFLVRAARKHSREMAATGVLEHSDDLASVPGKRPWTIIGENVGYGPSMDSLHEAFLNSPPHRRNELNRKYDDVGVGVARGNDGRIWITVLFLG